MTVQTTLGINRDDANLLSPGYPIVGGDTSGQNLILRSTNAAQKGSVLLDEVTPSASSTSGTLTSLGGIAAKGNFFTAAGFLSQQDSFSVGQVNVLQAGSGYPTGFVPPVTISPPNETVGGTQASAVARMSGGALSTIVVTNPGSGYLTPPTITIGDPYGATDWVAGQTAVLNSYIRVFNANNNGFTYFYQVTSAGALGTSRPTHTSSSAANGSATLNFAAQLPIVVATLGLTSMVHSGAIHQTGNIVNTQVSAGGSGYTTNPIVEFEPPSTPGGRLPRAFARIASGAVTAIEIIDPGSGYLFQPTVTIRGGGGTGAAATAIIGNSAIKPIVGTTVTNSTTYTIDFGMRGHNILFHTTNTNLTVAYNTENGFPQGRQVTFYVKNTSGGTITITFSNQTAANTNTNTSTPSISSGRTARFDLFVLEQTNLTSAVYATWITS